MPPKKWMMAALRCRLLGVATAEDHVGKQQAETRTRVGFDQENQRLALRGSLLDAERGEDAMVDGVVEEQHLGRLDQDRGKRDKTGADQGVNARAERRRNMLNNRADDREGDHGEDHAEDTGREVVDQHLEAWTDLAVDEPVELLNRPAAERPHQHGAEEHRNVGANDDASRDDGTHNGAALAIDQLAAGIAQEKRQKIGDHRTDKLGEELVREPAGRDEESSNDAPGDKRANIGHHHAAQEAAHLLDAHLEIGGRSVAPSGCGYMPCPRNSSTKSLSRRRRRPKDWRINDPVAANELRRRNTSSQQGAASGRLSLEPLRSSVPTLYSPDQEIREHRSERPQTFRLQHISIVVLTGSRSIMIKT